jgi:hypothetical protein
MTPGTTRSLASPLTGLHAGGSMAFAPIKLRVLAEEKEDENWKFRAFLKHHCCMSDAQLEERVFELTRRVWAGIDCTACANCCKHINPTFSEDEVDRLARRLGMERQQFIDAYLQATEAGRDNPWKTRTTPCPFLKDNRCSVYEDRPGDCSGYPYLYESEFRSRTIAMIERTFTCPIVFEVMEELKKSVRFSARPRRKR